MKKLRKYIDEFVRSCKKSKRQAVINIFCSIGVLVLACALVALTIFAVYKVTLWALGVIFFLWLFVPGILDNISLKMNTTPQIPSAYPVYFGWRDGRVVPVLIDNIFAEVYSVFQVCYYENVHEKENRIIYTFKIVPRPDLPVNYDFHILVQNMAEKILAASLAEWNMTAPCGNMVAVKLSTDTLCISFAKNNAGIDETITYQEQLYKTSHNPTEKNNDNFTENWDDTGHA